MEKQKRYYILPPFSIWISIWRGVTLFLRRKLPICDLDKLRQRLRDLKEAKLKEINICKGIK